MTETKYPDYCSYAFKSYYALLETADGQTEKIYRSGKNAFVDAEASLNGASGKLSFLSSTTLNQVTYTVPENITWKILDGTMPGLWLRSQITIEGAIEFEGSGQLELHSYGVMLKMKGDWASLAGDKIVCPSDYEIAKMKDGDYTVFDLSYIGEDAAASYKLPGGDWVGVKSFSDAVAKANGKGGIIRLEKNIDNAHAELNNCTLDLNGYSTRASALNIGLSFGDNLTIKDSSEAKTGRIYSAGLMPALQPGKNGGSVTIESGSIVCNDENNFAIKLSTKGDAKATVTIGKDAVVSNEKGYAICVHPNDDGENYANAELNIYGTVTSGGYGAIYINGQMVETDGKKPVINIYDGAVVTNTNNAGGAAVYAAGYGEWNISGGEISGFSGIYQKSGKFNVTGGTIKGVGTKTEYDDTNGGFTVTGDAFIVDSCGYPGGAPVVEITGGNFTSEEAQAVGSYVYNDPKKPDVTNEKVVGFISGGTFSSGDAQAEAIEEELVSLGHNEIATSAGQIVVVEGDGDEAITTEVAVEFDETDNPRVYDIYVATTQPKNYINRLMSAQLKFVMADGTVGYVIEPADKVGMTTAGDVYEFNFDGINDASATGMRIKIGTVTFEGYGEVDFSIDAEYAGSKVNTAKSANNIVNTYVPDPAEGEGKLVLDDKIVTTLEPAKEMLTINVTFPNKADDQAAAYQDMKVTISGGDLPEAIVYNLGTGDGAVAMTDGKYVVEAELTQNTSYTVKVEGAGYRTARYTVNMSEAKTLTFWNNVMDNAQVIETGKDASAVTKNFLAGDIVKDNKINIYDLSAVVSYFGSANDVADVSAYAKYDLNRDGVIDSKDVAYVLVSWDE